MKVLIFNTLYHPINIGGAEVSVRDLAKGMAGLQVEIGIVTLGDKTEMDIVDGISVWRIKIKNLYWPYGEQIPNIFTKAIWHVFDINNIAYSKDLNKIFNEFKPDIIHTNNLAGFSVNVWEFAMKKRVKTVHTLRDYYLQCPKTTKFKHGKVCTQPCVSCNLLSIIKKRKSHSLDFVVGISHHILKDHLNEGFFENATTKVIYNGFDTKVNLKKTHSSKSQTLNIGFIGQINESKGFDYLIEQLIMLSSYDWKLHVAGKINAQKRQGIDAKAGAGKIKWYGFINSDDFYDKIDVLVVPSLWKEPFGRVVLEGIIHKKPVMASNHGGIPELIGVGNEKFLFDPENTNDLLKLLKLALEDKQFLNQFNFESVGMEKFSLNTLLNGYLEVYNTVLNIRD